MTDVRPITPPGRIACDDNPWTARKLVAAVQRARESPSDFYALDLEAIQTALETLADMQECVQDDHR